MLIWKAWRFSIRGLVFKPSTSPRSMTSFRSLTLTTKISRLSTLTEFLAFIITSDCKFDPHVNKMLAKPNKKLWFLQRLKSLEVSEGTLTEINCLFVRQTLEFAVQVWAPSLTAHNERRLEGIQRWASAIISKRKSETLSYFDRIGRPSLLSLKERRKNIIVKKFRFSIFVSQKQCQENKELQTLLCSESEEMTVSDESSKYNY